MLICVLSGRAAYRIFRRFPGLFCHLKDKWYFPSLSPLHSARFSKFYFSFHKLFFKNIPAPDESAAAAFSAIKSGFGVESGIIRFNPLRKSNILSFQQTHFNKHTCYIYILKQKLFSATYSLYSTCGLQPVRRRFRSAAWEYVSTK